MSRFQWLSDDQWTLIEDLLPVPTGKRGRPFRDARSMVEGIVYRYRYRCGIAWRDVPAQFGPWQTIWTWHKRMCSDGTWDAVLTRLLAAADAAGIIEWSVAVDSTIARTHQHATNLNRGQWHGAVLAAFAQAVLRIWLTERGDAPDQPLFPTRTGRRLSTDAVERLVRLHAVTAARTCPTIRPDELHPHVLRHTCAMSLLQAGIDTAVIALWLGHADIRSTGI